MSAFDKYNTPPPKISNRNNWDNPLLPNKGIPIAADDFIDSTANIDDPNNQIDPNNKAGNHSIIMANDDSNNGSNSEKHFDLAQFNKNFDKNKQASLHSQIITDQKKLDALAQESKISRISLYDLSLFEIIINTKNAWFNLLDDLLDQNFVLDTFTKENRLFYIGLTIIFFTAILYLYATIMSDNTDDNTDNNTNKSQIIKTIYHVHQYPQNGGIDKNKSRNKLSIVSDFAEMPSKQIATKYTKPIISKK
jgi:hypothetical protein